MSKCKSLLAIIKKISEEKIMNDMYETEISDLRWIVYDIPGNIGWISWLVCTYLCFNRGYIALGVSAIIPAVLMIIGVGELISERINGLDRLLTRRRLYRGFGSLSLGGIIAIPVSVIGIILKGDDLMGLMLVSAVLCALFACLLFKGYKKKQ